MDSVLDGDEDEDENGLAKVFDGTHEVRWDANDQLGRIVDETIEPRPRNKSQECSYVKTQPPW